MLKFEKIIQGGQPNQHCNLKSAPVGMCMQYERTTLRGLRAIFFGNKSVGYYFWLRDEGKNVAPTF